MLPPLSRTATLILLSDHERTTLQSEARPRIQPQLIFVWSVPVERIPTNVAKCKEEFDALH